MSGVTGAVVVILLTLLGMGCELLALTWAWRDIQKRALIANKVETSPVSTTRSDTFSVQFGQGSVSQGSAPAPVPLEDQVMYLRQGFEDLARAAKKEDERVLAAACDYADRSSGQAIQDLHTRVDRFRADHRESISPDWRTKTAIPVLFLGLALQFIATLVDKL